MDALTFAAARALVVDKVLASRQLESERVSLAEAAGRILAAPVRADRDYPPRARSIRDGYAVRAFDLPGTLEVIGEVRAGAVFQGMIWEGQCVEIMTGGLMPSGADAVVMVEYARRDGTRMSTDKSPAPGEFVNPLGAEAAAGAEMLGPGSRLGFAQVALLATYGYTEVDVYRRPRVAILSTGDEVIPISESPRPEQVRNSNAWSLAVQVARAGGVPTILPVAPDEPVRTRELMEQGLDHDLLLLSGGVSAGKYDFVEPVLAELGAEFYFDRVLIQPGQPLVFGRARERFFFGLPGNPTSTMVTFEVFGRAALELLAGAESAPLPMPAARITHPFSHKPGLTRFLPARLSADGREITQVRWAGSSDVAALAKANAFLVVDAERASWQAGDEIRFLLQ